jgi:hypothetical protein
MGIIASCLAFKAVDGFVWISGVLTPMAMNSWAKLRLPLAVKGKLISAAP